MVVYGEYLFIENFVTGGILLLLSGKFLGESCSPIRWIFASALCGVSGFTIFLNMDGTEGVLLRLVLTMAITFVGLENKNWRYLLKKTALFLCLTFLSGGGTMALFLWQQVPMIKGNGVLYIEAMTYVKLILFGTISFGLTQWLIRVIHERRLTEMVSGKVEITIKGKSQNLQGQVDSGNELRDPVCGRFVILVDQAGKEKLAAAMEFPKERFQLIPYHAVGTSSGLLKGLRTDRIVFREKEYKDVILAFYEGTFQGFEVLLGREVLNDDIMENQRVD